MAGSRYAAISRAEQGHRIVACRRPTSRRHPCPRPTEICAPACRGSVASSEAASSPTEDERRAYETDALTAYRAVPLAVVLPGSTEEVAEVLALSRRRAASRSSPRGAGTSLSGGALPSADAVVVGLARLNRILTIDYDNRIARVEAGVTNINITNAVVQHAASSTPPIRRASSPAPSPATSP